MDTLQDVALSLFEWVPQEAMPYLPLAFTALVAVIVWRAQRNLRTPFVAAAIAFTVSNAVLFCYILLQFLRRDDNRWLEGVQWYEAPEIPAVPSIDESGLLGDALSRLNGFVGGVNDVVARTNDVADQAEQLENIKRGVMHTFALAVDYGMYALLGSIVFLFSLIVFLLASRRARVAERDKNLDQLADELVAERVRLMWVERRLSDLTNGQFVDYDTYMEKNRAVYEAQVKASGHTLDQAWSYDPEIDYDGDPKAYAKQARRMSAAGSGQS